MSSRSTAARRRADRARVARVDRAGRGRARSHPLELRRACACCRRARARRPRRAGRPCSSAAASGMLSIAGGKFTTFRRIALDALERLRGDLGLRSAGARARAVARRRRSGCRRRAAAARPSVARRSRARSTSRASTAATRSSCSQPARDDPRCSSRWRPARPEVAAQVRWAREREWALTADDVLARRTTLASLGRAEDARARVQELLR